MAEFHTSKHLFLSILLVVFFCFYHSDSSRYDQEDLNWLDDEDDEINIFQSRHASVKTCNFTKGKWIYDQTYPLYDATCPYLSTAVTCRKNGRPDSDYEKWRWKPYGMVVQFQGSCVSLCDDNSCRFDALDFLGRMRRKRIMLVGDFIMKDQNSDCSYWCLPGVPDTWNEILNATL